MQKLKLITLLRNNQYRLKFVKSNLHKNQALKKVSANRIQASIAQECLLKIFTLEFQFRYLILFHAQKLYSSK